jgi:hypothetical protein
VVCAKSQSGIAEIAEEKDRLVLRLWQHDGIFHALRTDSEICEKIRQTFAKKEVLSFTYNAQLRILSVL